MPSADETYNSLLDFGIDTDIAREASKRYLGNVEAAADWCFGAGANVSWSCLVSAGVEWTR
jgi:hypothetical protein